MGRKILSMGNKFVVVPIFIIALFAYSFAFLYLITLSPNLFDIKITVLNETESPLATTIVLYQNDINNIKRIGTTDEAGIIYFLDVKEDIYTMKAWLNIYGIISTDTYDIDIREANIDTLFVNITHNKFTDEITWEWDVE